MRVAPREVIRERALGDLEPGACEQLGPVAEDALAQADHIEDRGAREGVDRDDRQHDHHEHEQEDHALFVAARAPHSHSSSGSPPRLRIASAKALWES